MVENKKYPIDYRNGCIDCPNLEQRIGSLLANMCYKAGVNFGVELFESDIQWIENNISKTSLNNNRDIFWRLDTTFHAPERSPYFMDYVMTFFKKFIDMPGIPPNVNRILLYLDGAYSFWYQRRANIPPYQHFFVDSWMRKTRGGG